MCTTCGLVLMLLFLGLPASVKIYTRHTMAYLKDLDVRTFS